MSAWQYCPTHGGSPNAWGCPECVRELRHENARLREAPPATEQVAQWMIKNGYATGHGDTVADLLGELEWQAKERGDPTQDGPR